jgi:hypothetical protein
MTLGAGPRQLDFVDCLDGDRKQSMRMGPPGKQKWAVLPFAHRAAGSRLKGAVVKASNTLPPDRVPAGASQQALLERTVVRVLPQRD